MFGLRASILPVVLKRRAKLTGRSRNCPPSSKTKSSTVCFTFAGGGRNLLSSNLNRPLLGRQHSTRAIRLIGDPALTCLLQPLSHRRAGICKKSLRVVLKRRAKLTGRSRNCPPSSKTKSSTVCFTFAGGGRNLLSSNLNRPLLGRQHSSREGQFDSSVTRP
nr:unnamed protein product [Callosobruchus chinensis]